MSRLLSLTVVVLLLGAVAASAAGGWTGITRASVKWANGSLPPTKNNPRTLTYSTTAQLTKITKLLNANHIVHRSGHPDPGMCAGGADLTIKILQKAKQTQLSAYVCGDKTYGSAGGNVRAFMRALDLPR